MNVNEKKIRLKLNDDTLEEITGGECDNSAPHITFVNDGTDEGGKGGGQKPGGYIPDKDTPRKW